MTDKSTLISNLELNDSNTKIILSFLENNLTTNLSSNIINILPQHSPTKQIEYFQTDKNIFKVVISKQINDGYTLKIGGNKYDDCINISILTNNGIPTQVKIGYIQSEVECGYGSIMNDTANFISASLQYCKLRFPGIQQFEFDDMSRIDCGISKSQNPPRRPEKPFSLAHFSLAKYGQTWYEQKFGAKMSNPQLYKIYKNNVQKLFQPIQIDFSIFIHMAFLTTEQVKQIETYYSPSKTWVEFFSSIPKSKHCELLFNWLESFIEKLLQGSYNPKSWIIDANTIPNISIQMNIQPSQVGGRTSTRRNNRRKTQFKNMWPNTMNFMTR